MRREMTRLALCGALAIGTFATTSSAREGDKGIQQVRLSTVPDAAQEPISELLATGRDGKVYRIENAAGEQFAATYQKKKHRYITRVDAKGRTIDAPRLVTDSDLAFLKTAKEDKSQATAAAPAEKKDEDTTEAQLAAAMEVAQDRTPMDREDLPQPVQDAINAPLKKADTIGYYKQPDGNFLIHFRDANGKMMEMTVKADGKVAEQPKERDILKASMPIKEEDLPDTVQKVVQQAMKEGNINNPQRMRYFRVGEDDYAVQFLNEKGRQMSIRVDADGSIVNPLRETKKQGGGKDNQDKSNDQKGGKNR